MATNEGWPEAFGFALSHGSPCVVSWIEEGGSAQQAGLQSGDVLVQLDEEDVREWSVVDVIERARIAKKVPPSLLVKSTVSNVSLPRKKLRGFGISFRGDCPVYVRSVDFDSAGWEAGIRSGDLLLEVGGVSVRYFTKWEVLELMEENDNGLSLVVVKGGLQNQTAPSNTSKNKSKLFHDKVNYFFQHDQHKKTQLLTVLKIYNKNRDVDGLGQSVDMLLETPIERRLLRDIRGFLLPNHLPCFDALVSYEPNRALSRIHRGLNPSPLLSRSRSKNGRSGSLPNIFDEMSRKVVVVRDSKGGYGFSLSGNAPVFIRSVDTASPAASAGLNPGDYILEINQADVRSATHSHVLRLLKGGGGQPSILVSPHPPVWTGSPLDSRSGSTTLALPETKIGSVQQQSRMFSRKMDELLAREERSSITSDLKRYSQHKDLPELVDRLSDVISDRRKSVLFHYICQMLPEKTQPEFDNLAATKLATNIKRQGTAASATSGRKISPLAVASIKQQRLQTSRREKEEEEEERDCHGNRARGYDPGLGNGEYGTTILRQEKQRSHTQETRELEGNSEKPKEDYESVKRRLATRPLPPIPTDTPSDTPPTLPSNVTSHRKARKSKKKEKPLKHGAETVSVQPPSYSTLTPTNSPLSTPNNTTLLSPPPPPPPPPPSTPLGGVGIPVPPPPPPPMPGSGGSITSRPKTKRVNWDKVQGQSLEGTIWKELSGLEEALEYCELEEQFSVAPTKVAATGKSNDKKPSVLDPKKAYNIAILIGHLKMSSEAVKEAVLSCNTEVLSDTRLSQMEAFAPDKRECLAFTKYHKDPTVLGPADQFSCEMSTIPYYTERLRAMIYKAHFTERYEEIQSDLKTIIAASLSLQNSKKLKKILELVLKIGNFLNVGGSQTPAAAQGFRIRFLTQLKDLRTSDKKSTLIHYLFTIVEQKYPQVLTFPAELTAVKGAARVSGETLELEVSELKAGLMEIKHSLSEISTLEEIHITDKFTEIMTPFLSAAESKLQELIRLYSEMRVHFNRVAKFFSEDPAASCSQVDEFFGTFATFLGDFERVQLQIQQSREKEAERQRQKEEGFQWSKRASGVEPDTPPVVDLREELARRVAARDSSHLPDTDSNGSPPTVFYDRETFF